jgi:hypothetical protein
MESFFHDSRYASRILARSPGFTIIAVLTLALGIGANSAIFRVVNAVVLKPLPYEKPEKLVQLGMRFTGIWIPNARTGYRRWNSSTWKTTRAFPISPPRIKTASTSTSAVPRSEFNRPWSPPALGSSTAPIMA